MDGCNNTKCKIRYAILTINIVQGKVYAAYIIIVKL